MPPLNPPASGGKRHSRCYEPPPVHGGIEGGYYVSPVLYKNAIIIVNGFLLKNHIDAAKSRLSYH